MREARPEWHEVMDDKRQREEAARLEAQRSRVPGVRSGVASLDLSSMTDVLDFEQAHQGNAPGKEALIRDVFRMSAVRYYQVLNRYMDLPAALAHNPMLVHRLLDRREKRRADQVSRRVTRAK